MKKKLFVGFFFTLLYLIITSSFAMAHECIWGEEEWHIEPTCNKPGVLVSSCTRGDCGLHNYVEVAPTRVHDYLAATCTEPETCRFGCGNTNGAPLGHDYMPATCRSPMRCTRCDGTTGDKGDHDYTPWKCNATVTCNLCPSKIQNTGNHNFTSATCVSAAKCTKCNEIDGDPLGHQYNQATCQIPAACSRCNDTTGSTIDHLYVNGRCVMCNRQEVVINSFVVPPPETE